jgi:hypothetical protein
MKIKLLSASLLALALQLPVVHAEEAMSGAEKPAVAEAALLSVEASVAAIDHDTREVTLETDDGESVTVTVGPEARNLDQVEVGDRVEVQYYQAVAVEVLAPSDIQPSAGMVSRMERAPEGEKPGAMLLEETTVTAIIDAIDRNKEQVTLTGPGGETKTVKVRNPANLEKVAVGDQVRITYTKGFAVDVREKSAEE